ncbi:hypothetical protein BC834DRAFT_896282 [Gloeopeniophorella convolvens]|nr:hypothetical protein BC834DRAFT_896282 [Gloeopeniophorella convolvens]
MAYLSRGLCDATRSLDGDSGFVATRPRLEAGCCLTWITFRTVHKPVLGLSLPASNLRIRSLDSISLLSSLDLSITPREATVEKLPDTMEARGAGRHGPPSEMELHQSRMRRRPDHTNPSVWRHSPDICAPSRRRNSGYAKYNQSTTKTNRPESSRDATRIALSSVWMRYMSFFNESPKYDKPRSERTASAGRGCLAINRCGKYCDSGRFRCVHLKGKRTQPRQIGLRKPDVTDNSSPVCASIRSREFDKSEFSWRHAGRTRVGPIVNGHQNLKSSHEGLL